MLDSIPESNGKLIPNVKRQNGSGNAFPNLLYAAIMPRWSEPAFRARVEQRAQQLGLSVAELLGRADVAVDLLRKTPRTYGRSILTIEKIADACGWTLAQAIGADDPGKTGISGTDPVRIRLAIIAADRTIGGNIASGPERLAALADLAGYAYDLLSDWSSSGAELDERTALGMVEASLRRRFANQDLPRS
jgi:hypothetical protein